MMDLQKRLNPTTLSKISIRYRSNERKNLIILLTYVAASIKFFNPSFLANLSFNINNYIYGVLLILIIPYNYLFFIKVYKSYFSKPIKILILSIILAIAMATVLKKQFLLHSIFATIFPVGSYLTFLFITYKRIKTITVERVILIFGICYIILYCISFIMYPIKILHFQDFDDERGIQRIIINGIGFLFLFFFMSISKFFLTSKVKWILFSVISYTCILATAERMYIASASLLAFIFIIKKQNKYVRIVSVICLIFLFDLIYNTPQVQMLIEKTGNEVSVLSNYIRYQSLLYFLNDFQQSSVTLLFGNGFAYGNKSAYGLQMMKLHDKYYWVEDLGFFGLYVYLGLLSIIAYLVIYLKIFKLKQVKGYEYAFFFMYFIALNGLTNYGTYSENFVMPIVLSLYIIQIIKHKSMYENRVNSI
ncbi:hypothetical protein [Spirosoma oryzicola]|uniref:hypothetical protein n=1 Tax=Spirosoma oryzicola TaxID=2898794 RepID=UPI001E3FF562|nr:hypothetical protein [Spirosoma oryzicola]UHG93159.1 hypothetical protein LQ777_09720 [Spirosoma oryzicola]